MKFFNLMIPLALTQIKMQLNVTMSNQAWRVDVDGKVEHEKTRIENSSIVDDMRRNMLGIVQDVQDTKEILANNSDLLTLSGNDEYRELHTVAYNGHKDIVQSLLDRGADVNAKDSDGWTALHWAAYNGYEEIVKALVRAGANVDTKNNRGETALHWAAYNGFAEIVQLLLDKGAEVNATDKYGITALHLASRKGAEVNAKDKSGETALYEATRQGHAGIVKLLLAKGANVDAKDHDGRTALFVATQQGNTEIIEALVKDGAKLDASNNKGHTALHVAAYKGHEKTVNLLVNKRVNLEAKDSNGMTALHLAILEGHEAIVKLLLAKEADVDATNKLGVTALHTAVQKGHVAIVQLLLDSGSDINKKDNGNKTPFDYVQGNIEVAKLLNSADETTRDWYTSILSSIFLRMLVVVASLVPIGRSFCYALCKMLNIKLVILNKSELNKQLELQDKKNKLRAGLTNKNNYQREFLDHAGIDQTLVLKEPSVDAIDNLEETALYYELTTINYELKNPTNDDFTTKYYVINAGLEIPISEQDYNNLSKKNEIEENKKVLVERHKQLLIDIALCETIDEATKLARTKSSFEGSYKKLKERIESRNKEIESIIGLEQYLERCWNTINRNHMNVLSETKKTEINKELYNNTKEICKLLKLDVPAIKGIIHQIPIRSEVDRVATEINKNMKKLSEEFVDQSEELGELYDEIKLQKEEIRTENNQEEKNKFIKILEELKAEHDIIYKEQLGYLAAVKLSYTFIFQQFQGMQINKFLTVCKVERGEIAREIDGFIKFLARLGIDSQGNGTIIGSTLSSMLLSRISMQNTTNLNELTASLDGLETEIKNWFKIKKLKVHDDSGDDSDDDNSESNAIELEATKHIGLLGKKSAWRKENIETFTAKVRQLRENEGLQQKQCILNNKPHAEKQKKHHLNDSEKVQDDFKKGLERLNEEFKEYHLETIKLNDNQLASLADFFINNANIIFNNGSHYRLEYPGVIIPSEHTPLKEADIADNWIRLKIISSMLSVKT